MYQIIRVITQYLHVLLNISSMFLFISLVMVIWHILKSLWWFMNIFETVLLFWHKSSEDIRDSRENRGFGMNNIWYFLSFLSKIDWSNCQNIWRSSKRVSWFNGSQMMLIWLALKNFLLKSEVPFILLFLEVFYLRKIH
jgi:hypothetical protein